jgi:FtsZ-interacting cell division protein YlmF
MALKEALNNFVQHLRQGPRNDMEGTQAASLSNGGYTGWHPIPEKKKNRNDRNGATGTFRTGYTAANAPVNAQTGYQQTGYAAQTGYQQTGYQAQTGYQQTGYQAQTGYQQTGYQAQTGYQQGLFPPQNTYQQTGYVPNGGFAFASNASQASQNTTWQQGFQASVREAAPQEPQGNLRYFPGSYVADDGTAFRMVERLAQPVSAASCYRLIEFMRNGESIIVNTELIHDEYEITRCLDLLYGAAFTMGYTFTRISSRSIYLISPANVMVMPYESLRQLNEQDAAQRWPGSTKESVGFQQEARSARKGTDFRGRTRETGFGHGQQQRYSV